MTHKNIREHTHRPSWFRKILVTIFVASAGITGILTIDYLQDKESDILRIIGLEKKPFGPKEMSAPSGAPQSASAQELTISKKSAKDYIADNQGLPLAGMENVNLSGISPGGGQGPQNHDWSKMNPSELAIPQANLIVPVVPRGLINTQDHRQEMDLPVSFQAAWLTSASPVTASAGTTVIAGHVNWADGSWAPMSNLYNATPGMSVITTDSAGTPKEWTVEESKSVPQNELSRLFTLTETSGRRQLILITCEATTDAQGNLSFTMNHVVTAKPKHL